jgi:penicillin-binding protein 2
MLHKLKNYFKKKTKQNYKPIDPDEIFLDSQNLPDFNKDQFEGRIERPIGKNIFTFFFLIIIFVILIFAGRIWNLQVINGANLTTKSQNNSLHTTPVLADRGLITDRNGTPFVWNNINENSPDFSLRVYATSTGLSTLLGYVKYPTKDSSGIYYQDQIVPITGLEKIYNTTLSGVDGSKILETDVRGKVISESVVHPPVSGANLTLSIDAVAQKDLYDAMLAVTAEAGFKGGSGVIMDINTGEIIASATFPEFSSQVLTDGSDSKQITAWLTDSNKPFLNRTVDGLYTPGSIVKPFIAMGVLDQKVIDPLTKILSTGSISVPNPYDKNKPSIFMDWRANGWVDLRHAIAVSSDVYFYEVGGGFQAQKGIGIDNIGKYTEMFGFGTTTNINFPGEQDGTIPSPAWKAANFNGEIWRVGDTYNTTIGQYGFQVTPIQAVRAVAAIANGGTLLTPTFLKNDLARPVNKISLDQSYFQIVREGMRLCVTEGTCTAINLPVIVNVAAKTGTAQLGVSKDLVNSWVIGFWPYENPKYAFAVVMERASKTNQFGAALVIRQFLDSLPKSNLLLQ